MEVPKARCREGSVQATQSIQRLHKSPHPCISFFTISCCRLHYEISMVKKKRGRDGVSCVIFVCSVLPVHCHP